MMRFMTHFMWGTTTGSAAMGSQIVRVFGGGSDIYSDQRMAERIEKYAEENRLTIQLISYAVGLRSGYAMVVFVPAKEVV